MSRFTMTVHPDQPFGYVDGRPAQFFATIDEADAPHANAAVVCDFRQGAGPELVAYHPLTLDALPELAQLMGQVFGMAPEPTPGHHCPRGFSARNCSPGMEW